LAGQSLRSLRNPPALAGVRKGFLRQPLKKKILRNKKLVVLSQNDFRYFTHIIYRKIDIFSMFNFDKTIFYAKIF
jgi:hypothetical protein